MANADNINTFSFISEISVISVKEKDFLTQIARIGLIMKMANADSIITLPFISKISVISVKEKDFDADCADRADGYYSSGQLNSSSVILSETSTLFHCSFC